MNRFSFGSSTALQFVLSWENQGVDAPMLATRGWLGAYINGHEVWIYGGPGSESWPWIELLEFFGYQWRFIEHEIGVDPLGLDEPLERIRDLAEDRWNDQPEDVRDREEEELLAYLRSHDLSQALRGALAPKLFVARRTEEIARVSAAGILVDAPWPVVRDALVGVADAITARIGSLTDERSLAAVRAWRERDALEPDVRLALALGRSRHEGARLRFLLGADDFPTTRLERLAVAARMVPDSMAIEELAPFFRAFTPRVGGTLQAFNELRGGAITETKRFERECQRPYEVGYALARWFREVRNIDTRQRIDINAELATLGVVVIDVDVEFPEVDALCALGPEISPTIVVNLRGRHARGRLGRRATLAHELCHLLADLGITMPYAEAQSLRAPKAIEQRARAFAAELLFSQTLAAEEKQLLTVENAAETVRRLIHRFDASTEVIVWQLINAPGTLDSASVRRLTELLVGE